MLEGGVPGGGDWGGELGRGVGREGRGGVLALLHSLSCDFLWRYPAPSLFHFRRLSG